MYDEAFKCSCGIHDNDSGQQKINVIEKSEIKRISFNTEKKILWKTV